MRAVRGLKNFFLLLLFMLAIVPRLPALLSNSSDFLKESPRVDERFLDLRSFLFKIGDRYNLSVIVAQDVRSPLKEVKGKTIKEVLDNYLANTKFTYRIQDNCIFVAPANRLELFFEKLPEDSTMLPKGRGDVSISGVFYGIDIAKFCKILRNITDVEIRPVDSLKANLMLRLIKMPWKKALLAIVRLNDYRMIRSEFSVTIDKHRLEIH
ncbi:MAG: hypothetical protein Kow0029_09970 [Candidatus Rifleibacteriota bacterium]